MPLDEMVVAKQVRRLQLAYNTSKPTGDIVKAWLWVMRDDLEPDELMSAVSEYARGSSSYFPTPGKILEIALRQRRDSGKPIERGPQGWDQRQEGPCPVCGAVMQLLSPEQMGQHEVYDVVARKAISVDALREAGSAMPPQRYGVLHNLTAHDRAGKPAIGYGTWNPTRGLLPGGRT